MILDTLDSMDSFMEPSGMNITRSGNLDIAWTWTDGSEEEQILCHIPILHPYLDLSDPSVPALHSSAIYSIDYGAAAMLAMQHLNSGDGSVLPELAGHNERCPVRFTAEMVDTQAEPNVGINRVLEVTSRDNGLRRPCAFLGAMYSTVSSATAMITGLRDYAQMSDGSSSIILDDKGNHPTFGRTMPRDNAAADVIVEYMRGVLGIKHVAVMYVSNLWGNSFAAAFEHAVKNHPLQDMKVSYIDVPYVVTEASLERLINFLQGTEYRYFVGLVQGDQLQTLWPKLVENGLAETEEHSWYFTDSVDTIPWGAGYFLSAGGREGSSRFEALLKGVDDIKNSPEDMRYLKSKLPVHEDNVGDDERATLYNSLLEEFQEQSVDSWVGFTYDAVVTMALAACNITARGETLTGASHFKAITEISFDGVSGSISFEPDTGSRKNLAAVFELWQDFPEDGDWDSDWEGGEKISSHVTHVYDDGKWTEKMQYVYNGGSTIAPLELPPAETNPNYIPNAMRGVAYGLSAVGVFLAIGFFVWTHIKRNSRVVKASQPIFMELVCAGSMLMSLSIIPMGFDPGIASEDACDAACMTTPWLLSIGNSLVFGALYTKTKRILMVLAAAHRFSRVAVTTKDVTKPLAFMLGLNILVLSLWSGIAPLEWQIEVIDTDFFGRPTETVGYCGSPRTDNLGGTSNIIFLTFLCIINLGAVVLALHTASRAQKISTEFAETKYIFRSLGVMAVIGFIGLPSLVIASDRNYSALFFLYSTIITAIVLAILLFIFIPKVRLVRQGVRLGSMSGGTGTGVGIKILADGRTRDNLLMEIQELKSEITEVRRLRTIGNTAATSRSSATNVSTAAMGASSQENPGAAATVTASATNVSIAAMRASSQENPGAAATLTASATNVSTAAMGASSQKNPGAAATVTASATNVSTAAMGASSQDNHGAAATLTLTASAMNVSTTAM